MRNKKAKSKVKEEVEAPTKQEELQDLSDRVPKTKEILEKVNKALQKTVQEHTHWQ